MTAASHGATVTDMAPPLEHHCGSWIIVSKATGLPVLETFSEVVADAINTEKYVVLTALQWLVRLNRSARLT
jgi:hypothetical protein